MQRYIVRQIGERNGHPRIYLDVPEMAHAGFAAGKTYRRSFDPEAQRLTLSVEDNGSHVVSRKDVRGKTVPVIDINSSELLKPFDGMQAVRIVIDANRIHILPLASEVRRTERLDRLAKNLAAGRIDTAAASFGGGVLDHASHTGLKAAGIDSHLVFAN